MQLTLKIIEGDIDTALVLLLWPRTGLYSCITVMMNIDSVDCPDKWGKMLWFVIICYACKVELIGSA